jgi:hypothetical protein
MCAPALTFSLLFDPATVSSGFIRFGGGLLALFGLYYVGAMLGSLRGAGVAGFYASTVAGRLLLAVFCIWLFWKGDVGAGIIFFAAMNGIGALSMLRAMQADSKQGSTHSLA